MEGDLEGVEGGFPAVGPASLSSSGGVQAHDREVDALEGGGLGREVAAGVDRAPDPGVDGFEALLSSSTRRGRGLGRALGVVPHVSDDVVGELAFVGSSGRAFSLVLVEFFGDMGCSGFG